MIAIQGYTRYENWCTELGIDLELTPSYTHEPNGGIERAGKEVIERSIKMSNSANLPAELWVESTMAAIYLFNRSPSLQNRELASPNKVLDSWFRQYFR